MKHYYSNILADDQSRNWTRLKASNLAQAKIEAVQEEGGGYAHHFILVGQGSEQGDITVVAKRPMRAEEWI